jgi:putative hemolysin
LEPPVDSFLQNNLILLFVSLVFCALLSFIETAVVALRLFKLKELSRETGRYQKLFYVFEHNPNRILISILIAYNVANVLAAVSSAAVMESIMRALNVSERLGFAIGIFVTSVTILITDLIPKNIATIHGDRLFKSTLWITNVIYLIFSPFVTLLSTFTDTVTRWIGGTSVKEIADAVTSEKEIQFLINYINEKGLMERHKTAMLKSIFELGTTPIRDVMVPETSVISINVNSTQKETLDLFSKYQFTRLPVYEEKPDNIIGMVHQKDFFQLLSKNEDRPLRDIVRPIMFVPESAKALRVLKEFREQRMHIAMVLNEFGGITGLVTLEDVIEEIVGEISDEYEAVPEKVTTLSSGGYLVDASIDLEELGSLLGIEFEAEDALTLGGFLIEQLERVPKPGERLEYKNYHFKVQQASPKRIDQVLIFANELPEDLEAGA